MKVRVAGEMGTRGIWVRLEGVAEARCGVRGDHSAAAAPRPHPLCPSMELRQCVCTVTWYHALAHTTGSACGHIARAGAYFRSLCMCILHTSCFSHARTHHTHFTFAQADQDRRDATQPDAPPPPVLPHPPVPPTTAPTSTEDDSSGGGSSSSAHSTRTHTYTHSCCAEITRASMASGQALPPPSTLPPTACQRA